MEFQGICLTFNCETNGYQGGDAGHGGQTIITIKNYNDDATFIVNGNQINSENPAELIFQGDWELNDLIHGLEKITKYLKQNNKENIMMKEIKSMNDIVAMSSDEVIDWCTNLTNDEKDEFQNWIGETGKEDLMSVKHYLGRKFYPQFYKEKVASFAERLEKALSI